MPSLIDIILILALAGGVIGSSLYLIHAKKSGKACIGCSSKGCACTGEKTCHCGEKKKEGK